MTITSFNLHSTPAGRQSSPQFIDEETESRGASLTCQGCADPGLMLLAASPEIQRAFAYTPPQSPATSGGADADLVSAVSSTALN